MSLLYMKGGKSCHYFLLSNEFKYLINRQIVTMMKKLKVQVNYVSKQSGVTLNYTFCFVIKPKLDLSCFKKCTFL